MEPQLLLRQRLGGAVTALVAALVTAAAEAGSSGGSGDSGLRWEGECEVKKWTTPSQV